MTIIKKIAETIEGDVRDDLFTRNIYSVDASIYEIVPQAIVLPKSTEDIIQTVTLAKEDHIPLIARGGGTGIAGGCIGEGIIIDTSRYLNKIETVEQDFAWVQPGVIQDDLNHFVEGKGVRLGPDTSTANRATIGGMVATNATGKHFLHYGNMKDHVLEVELVLSSGDLITVGQKNPPSLESKIKEIAKRYQKDIETSFPKIKRRSSGYNLEVLLENPLNLAKLIAGSEGTLGVISRVKVRLSPLLKPTKLVLLSYQSIAESFKQIPSLLSYHPVSLELVDENVISMGRASLLLGKKLEFLKDSKALLLLEFENEPPIQGKICTEEEKKTLVEMRKLGLGLLMSKRSYKRAVAFIEDIAIPPENLFDFIIEFQNLLKQKNIEAGIYGHAGDGCLHIRPYIDLRKEEEFDSLFHLQQDVLLLVLKYQGVLSGEHGDGIIRTHLNKKLFGKRLYDAFSEIKYLFDPDNLMNPGKVCGHINPKENLRLSPQTKQVEVVTFLNFEKEGGLTLAADLCNGNAECRKKTGLMCPSYHGLSDERLTTRARAQSLRAILNGKMPFNELSGQGLHDVLDLCLECKGCKVECPSGVNMAKMKAEILYHYNNKHGVSLRSKLFGHISEAFEKGSLAPFFFNLIGTNPFIKTLLKIDPKRSLPKLSKTRFSKVASSQKKDKKVILFNDTYTEFIEPNIGRAAIELLNSLGFEVIVPPYQCCGKPLISKGFLRQAREKALRLIQLLASYGPLPIIALEPSCLFTINDDFQDLVPRGSSLKIIPLELFLAEQRSLLQLKHEGEVVIHTHCHQKASPLAKATYDLLKNQGFSVSEIDSGCCGMAGSFGYEKEHSELSFKIGADRLFPSIEKTGGTIVANGFSCRCQIQQGTNKRGYHLAEILRAR